MSETTIRYEGREYFDEHQPSEGRRKGQRMSAEGRAFLKLLPEQTIVFVHMCKVPTHCPIKSLVTGVSRRYHRPIHTVHGPLNGDGTRELMVILEQEEGGR